MAWWGFNECRGRIYRAKDLSDALAARWHGLTEDDPYSVHICMQNDGTGTLNIVPFYERFPEEFGLELGELLYHLRAALDSAVYAAAVHQKGQKLPSDGRNLGFPICHTPDAFEDSEKKIEPLTCKSKIFIESVQPYNTANPPIDDLYVGKLEPAYNVLSIINAWSIKDRHRSLHLFGTLGYGVTPNIILPPGCELEYVNVTPPGILERKDEIAKFKLSGFVAGMEVHADTDITLDIGLIEPPYPCVDWDTFGERITRMLNAVGYVVNGLEGTLVPPSCAP